MKAFFGTNFITGINKLLSFKEFWSTDKFFRNEKIQNVITGTRFQSTFFLFSNIDNGDKTDELNKMRPVIKHLNKVVL